jgi:YD repeat-containing protein
MSVTLTVRRSNEDLTVALDDQGRITDVLDEQGEPATLTMDEHRQVIARWEAGEDETGR